MKVFEENVNFTYTSSTSFDSKLTTVESFIFVGLKFRGF